MINEYKSKPLWFKGLLFNTEVLYFPFVFFYLSGFLECQISLSTYRFGNLCIHVNIFYNYPVRMSTIDISR